MLFLYGFLAGAAVVAVLAYGRKVLSAAKAAKEAAKKEF